jgi:hypothetical protein
MATFAEHYAAHLVPLYEWMLGDVEAALQRSAVELDAVGLFGVSCSMRALTRVAL